MLIDCNTKGCRQKTNAKLNVGTGEVICEDCGNVVEGITEFTKKALKGMGQILRNVNKKPFQVMCTKCNEMRSLYLDEGKAFCKKCHTPVQITASFMQGLKMYSDGETKEIVKTAELKEEEPIKKKRGRPAKKDTQG